MVYKQPSLKKGIKEDDENKVITSKRGVSTVVANVLIVLLVIVGIAVIWAVVNPTIENSARNINSECFTFDIDLQSCIAGTATPTQTPYTITYQRNPGQGAPTGAKMVFSRGTLTTSSDAVITSGWAAELSTGSLTANLVVAALPATWATLTTPISATVVYQVGPEKVLCQQSIAAITCT